MNPVNFFRSLVVIFLAGLLGACSSSDGAASANCEGTGNGSIALSGTVTFEDVPVVTDQEGRTRLDYGNIQQKPVRLAQMLVECADGSTVYAESVTDAAGNYSVEVPQGVDARLVVRAASTRSDGPNWDIEVVDNTNGQAVWTLEGESFATGDSDLSVDLVATSGWDGSSYTGDRIGGAFSVYDTVHEAMQLVLNAEQDAVFEQLTLNWSPNNSTCDGDISEGCIGTSFYSGGAIYILGKEDEDTDEYDDSVVAHEWGHYYEDSFSRSDSIGGSHGGGDVLDIRVAFSEGWGNAVSGMILDETFYRDTLGISQSTGFAIGLETQGTSDQGWWNEISVQLILFDLFDNASDGADTFSLGFAPIHAVLTGSQRTTAAFTSLFSFITYMINDAGVNLNDMSLLLAENDISAIDDIWGEDRATGVDDSPDSEQVANTNPVYLDLDDAVNNGTVTPVCVSDFYGEYNKLGNRRFGRFQVSASGTYRFTLDGSGLSNPSDPDIYIYVAGDLEFSATDFSASNDPDENPDLAVTGDQAGIEVGDANLETGVQYTVDLHDWFNLDNDDSTGNEGCLELTVEQL